jgi:hypothetical protein
VKTKFLLITFCLAFFGVLSSFGQNEADTAQKQSAFSKFVTSDKVAFKLYYFGELVLHPGLSFGIDYTLIQKNRITFHWDSEIGGYKHKWNHNALFVRSGIGTRFPIYSLFVDLTLGAGYLHSFADGTIYQRSSSGGVEKATNWGNPHFMPYSMFLMGWDGTRNSTLPVMIRFGAEVYLQSSFNQIYLPHVAAKLGFTYKFKRKNR